MTLESTASENPQPEVYAGGLVGYQKAGNISGSYVVGTVKAVVNASAHSAKPAYAGGLVGYKEAGEIISNYADATVTAEHKDDAGTLNAYAGGLVGYHKAGDLVASYAIGAVSAETSATNGNAYAGGLVGEAQGRRDQGGLLLRLRQGRQLRQLQHLRHPDGWRAGGPPVRRERHRQLLHRRAHPGQGRRRERHGAQGRLGREPHLRRYDRRLLGHRQVRRHGDGPGDGQDDEPTSDAHGLRGPGPTTSTRTGTSTSTRIWRGRRTRGTSGRRTSTPS